MCSECLQYPPAEKSPVIQTLFYHNVLNVSCNFLNAEREKQDGC